MADKLSVDMGLNVTDVLRGSRNAAMALEQIDDSLDDLTRATKRDADKAGDAIGDGFQDGRRQAEREGDKLTDSLRDNFRQVQREAKDNDFGSSIADSTKKGTREAGESFKELGNEARQNASETFSSFDGSAQSFADGIQGTLGGIISSLGPVGAAAGAAGALGIGLITSSISNAQESSEEFKARVSDLATEMIQTGRIGATSFEFVVNKLQELAAESEKGKTNLADLRKAADGSGSSYKALAQAYAGNTDGLKDLYRAAKDHLSVLQEQDSQSIKSAGGFQVMQGATSKAADAQLQYVEYVKGAVKAADEAAKAQQNYADAQGPALERASAAVQSYADSVQQGYQEAGSATDDYTHDGVVNLDEYNASLKAHVDAINAYQQNMVTASQTLSDDALNYIKSLGTDAAPILDAFVKAPASKQQETANIWAALGKTSGSSFNSSVQGAVNGTSTTKTVIVDADLSVFNRQMADATRQREAHIRVYQDNVGGTRQGMGAP